MVTVACCIFKLDVQEVDENEEDKGILKSHRRASEYLCVSLVCSVKFKNYWLHFAMLLFFGFFCVHPPFLCVCGTCMLTICCFLCGLLAGSTADMLDTLWELYPRRLSEAGLTRHSGIHAVLL